MAKRITVVVSQGQSHNPVKRQLEEDLVAGLLMEPGVETAVVPHLYDLKADGTGILALQGFSSDLVVLGWLYERAIRWTLDRHEVRGKIGTTLLKADEEDDDDEEDETASAEEEQKPRVADHRTTPNRFIYCIDLRAADSAEKYLEEIRRIKGESQTQVFDLGGWINGSPKPEQLARFENPANDTALGANGKLASPHVSNSTNGNGQAESEAIAAPSQPLRVEEEGGRRWYPVIDYTRCTNCMECIDFCLFGVYGVDSIETILVEQPDNCRKGCPACSRVCPENAIMFPQHKTPAIAGAPTGAGGLKIDLSKLFGGGGASAEEIAARERDEQLLLAGREIVGAPPKRQESKAPGPKDALDNLLDELDDLDL